MLHPIERIVCDVVPALKIALVMIYLTIDGTKKLAFYR
jgi:hypothetical protein